MGVHRDEVKVPLRKDASAHHSSCSQLVEVSCYFSILPPLQREESLEGHC